MKHRTLNRLFAMTLLALLAVAQPTYLAHGTPSRAAITFSTTRLTDNVLDKDGAALAVDHTGAAHVAYQQYGGADFQIHYATNAGGAWTSIPLTNDPLGAHAPSIAADSTGHVHLAYVVGDGDGTEIYYATDASGTWTSHVVTANTTGDSNPSIAVDGSGVPHIAYMHDDGTDDEVYYATNGSGAWVNTSITSNATDDESPSLAVDGGGSVHIAYVYEAIASDEIHYATNAGGTWSSVPVTADSLPDDCPSLALDAGGSAHIVYEHDDSTRSDIYYATNAGGAWAGSAVTGGSTNSRSATLALDATGHGHIAYHSRDVEGDHEVYYANNQAGAWGSPVPLTDNLAHDFLGSETFSSRALALDAAGYAHIAYTSNSSGGWEIYYARSDQPVTPAAPGTCANPLPLACGQAVAGDTSGYANHHDGYTCGWNASGPEIIYTFTLAPGSSYDVTAEFLSFAGDVDLYLLAAGGCDAGQCLQAGAYGDTAATASSVPPGTYYVAVDGYQGATGSFDLQLTCAPAGGAYRIFVPLVARNYR